jgi:hypothetical protein
MQPFFNHGSPLIDDGQDGLKPIEDNDIKCADPVHRSARPAAAPRSSASSTPHTPSNAKAPAAVKPGLTAAFGCD